MDDLAPCDRATKPVAEKRLEMPRIPACPLGIGAIRCLICGVMSAPVFTRRAASWSVEICGSGMSSDSKHPTRPHITAHMGGLSVQVRELVVVVVRCPSLSPMGSARLSPERCGRNRNLRLRARSCLGYSVGGEDKLVGGPGDDQLRGDFGSHENVIPGFDFLKGSQGIDVCEDGE
jgi:hypothetical protein